MVHNNNTDNKTSSRQRPGSGIVRDQNPNAFPLDAFEVIINPDGTRTLTMKSGWKFDSSVLTP